MSSEIIQSVTYDNYNSQILISLFWGLLNDKKLTFR